MRVISRETCIWVTPMPSAISDEVGELVLSSRAMRQL
jgi:hypothetical protein